ncbi:MAG: sugar phosphate isomerase/epimerase [Oscillospiraceae bacterium]|jgi:sugar phosphate isomerase/epimerase|nr:sugar phosphate isomerase/epimerase [Oscillospiraceae bacterium]
MRFGMPTLIGLKTLDDCAALCRELGLSFVEISMDMPEFQAEKLNANELRRIAKQYGVSFTIHLEGLFDPCAFNRRVASAYTETALHVIELAKRIGMPVINMHLNSGDYITLPDRKASLYSEYMPEYIQKLTAFRDACASAVGGSDVIICVENTKTFLQDFAAEGVAALMESPVFGLTLDTGHNASSGFRQQRLIDRYIDRLRHVHLHDRSEERGDHLPLGEGGLDLKSYLRVARERDCRVILEIKTADGLRASVSWLRAQGYLA